ncbi:MAG: metal-dependent transcriptional regulator [Verrucomicrobia bacterium]|nr:metal-dependent transcriptional regulator [Verrucomicrobiota bacterium]
MQDYVKAIYKLQEGRDGVAKLNKTIAKKMQISPPSVTSIIKKLAEQHLVRYTPYRGVELTLAGEKIALEMIRHHRLLEFYLAEALGYSWDQVDAEADKLEHVISEEFEDRIDKVLNFSTLDPHGAPIPSKDGAMKHREYLRLVELPKGKTAVVRQVSDRDPDMLRYMGSLGLKPGACVEVREKAPFSGPLVLKIDSNEEQVLGLEVADHVYVTVT